MITKLKAKLSSDAHFFELIRGSSIALFFRVLGIGLGYIYTLLITLVYGAEAMGVFALSFTVLQIAAVVSRLGMDTAILRFTGENAKKQNGFIVVNDIYKKIIKVILPVGIFVTAGMYLLSPILAVNIFHKENMTFAFQLIATGILPMVFLVVHKEALRGLKKIGSYSFFNNVSIPFFASLSLLFILINEEKSTIMPVIAQICAILISVIIVVYIWTNECKLSLKCINKVDIKFETIGYLELFSVAFPMMLASSLFMVMNWTDIVMLGMFKNEEDVGIYNVTIKVSLLTSLILTAITSAAAPKFAELWGKKDIKKLEEVVKQSNKMIFWMTLPILIVYLAIPEYILKLFGTTFVKGSTALIILTIGQFINAISGSVGTLLSMTGQQVFVQNILICSISINLILNYLLVQNYGLTGVAIATASSTIFWNISMVFFIWKKFGFFSIKIYG